VSGLLWTLLQHLQQQRVPQADDADGVATPPPGAGSRTNSGRAADAHRACLARAATTSSAITLRRIARISSPCSATCSKKLPRSRLPQSSTTASRLAHTHVIFANLLSRERLLQIAA